MKSKQLLDKLVDLRRALRRSVPNERKLAQIAKCEAEKDLVTAQKIRSSLEKQVGVAQSEARQLINTLRGKLDQQYHIHLQIFVENVNTDNDYQILLAIAELLYAIEQNGIPKEHADKLYQLFGNVQTALIYLQFYAEAHDYKIILATGQHADYIERNPGRAFRGNAGEVLFTYDAFHGLAAYYNNRQDNTVVRLREHINIEACQALVQKYIDAEKSSDCNPSIMNDNDQAKINQWKNTAKSNDMLFVKIENSWKVYWKTAYGKIITSKKDVTSILLYNALVKNDLQWVKHYLTNCTPRNMFPDHVTLSDKDIRSLKLLLNQSAYPLADKHTFHDACLFQFHAAPESLRVWQQLAKRFYKESAFWKVLPFANKIEALITQNQNVKKPDAESIKRLRAQFGLVTSQWKQYKSRHGDLNEEEEKKYNELTRQRSDIQVAFAKASAGTVFNKNIALTILVAFRELYITIANPAYRQFLDDGITQEKYNEFKKLTCVDSDNIPYVLLEGALFGHEGYYLRRLNVTDAHDAALAARLGKITNCCQSFSGEAGEPCVRHGLTSPYGGFYVLFKKSSAHSDVADKVIGQCWAWRSKSGAIVFDSIEADLSSGASEVVLASFTCLAFVLVQKNFTHQVNCGVSNFEGVIVPREEFIDYEKYCDSLKQKLMIRNINNYYIVNNVKSFPLQIAAQLSQYNAAAVARDIKGNNLRNIIEAFWYCLNLGKSSIVETFEHLLKDVTEVLLILEECKEYKHFVMDNLQGKHKRSFSKFKNLAENKNFIDLRNLEGSTALLLAVNSELYKEASLLLRHGANVDSRNKLGDTPLILLQKNEQIEVKRLETTSLLLTHGADANAQNNDGRNALELAIENKFEKTALLLLEQTSNLEALSIRKKRKYDNKPDPLLIYVIKEKNV